jgi:hypothetical protein
MVILTFLIMKFQENWKKNLKNEKKIIGIFLNLFTIFIYLFYF